MIIVFLIIAAGLGTMLYLLIMYTSIPGAIDERLGELDPLPENLGQWVVDGDSPEAKKALDSGLQREVRILHQSPRGLFGKEKLVRQVRYRNQANGEIEHVEPEVAELRKRSKQRT